MFVHFDARWLRPGRDNRLNASSDGSFHIFKGIESDILPNGSLDYPEEILRRFDFIIGSIHGQFRMDRAAQTERLMRARRTRLSR